MAWLLLIHYMNTYLETGLSNRNSMASRLPEQGDAHSNSRAFQGYLDKGIGDQLPLSSESLTPDAIQSLAQALISALDQASMTALFFEGESERSPGSFLSTDLFMAMRSSAAVPVNSVDEEPVNLSIPESESSPLTLEKIVEERVIPSGREQFAPMIQSAAERHGLDVKLIEAVIQTESNFNAEAVSPVGAQGLMQLMPATAAELGVTDAFDPEQNIQGGSKYLKQLMDRYDGDTKLALAAYNWGMGNLERHPERMPTETINYVAKISGMMNNSV